MLSSLHARSHEAGRHQMYFKVFLSLGIRGAVHSCKREGGDSENCKVTAALCSQPWETVEGRAWPDGVGRRRPTRGCVI